MHFRKVYLLAVIILVAMLIYVAPSVDSNIATVNNSRTTLVQPKLPLNASEVVYNQSDFGIDFTTFDFSASIVDFQTGSFNVGGNKYQLAILLSDKTLEFYNYTGDSTFVDLSSRLVEPKALYKVNADSDAESELLILDSYDNITLLDNDGTYMDSLNITAEMSYLDKASLLAAKIGDLMPPAGQEDIALSVFVSTLFPRIHLINASNGKLSIVSTIIAFIDTDDSFALGNFTGDYYYDVVVLSAGQIRIFFGNNGIEYAHTALNTYSNFVLVGEMTGDSYDDILSYNASTDELKVLDGSNINNTVKSFSIRNTFSSNILGTPVLFDFTGDGLKDIVAAVNKDAQTLVAFIATNNMSAVKAPIIGGNIYKILLGDLSYDGTTNYKDYVFYTNTAIYYYDLHYNLMFLRYPRDSPTLNIIRIGYFGDVRHETVFIEQNDTLLILKSDDSAPDIVNINITPKHPTILDGSVEISYTVNDRNLLRDTYVEYTTDDWTTTHRIDSYSTSRINREYVALITNLQGKYYVVKLVAIDAFGNKYETYRTFNVVSEVKTSRQVGNATNTIENLFVANIDNDTIDDILLIFSNATILILNGTDLSTISRFDSNLKIGGTTGGVFKFYNVSDFIPTNPGVEILGAYESTISRQVLIYSISGALLQNISMPSVGDGFSLEVADFDFDFVPELLIGNYTKLLIVRPSDGTILYEQDLSPYEIYATQIADFNNDGMYEIYVLTADASNTIKGFLLDTSLNILDSGILFKPGGQLTTDFLTKGIYNNILTGRFSPYGDLYVVISNGSYSSKYALVNPLNNSILATYDFNKYSPNTLFYTAQGQQRGILDYDNDGIDDVLVYSEYINKIVILNGANLSELKTLDVDVTFTYKAYLLDYNGDNTTELAIFSSDAIYIMSLETGTPMYILPYASIDSCKARINYDNADDIVITDSDGFIYLLQDLDIRYRLTITDFLVSGGELKGRYVISQGTTFYISLNLKNYYNEEVKDADVRLFYTTYGYPTQASFTSGPYGYSLSISTSELPLGEYTFTIRVIHDYYTELVKNISVIVIGTLKAFGYADVITNDTGQYLDYEFWVVDENYNPVYNASVNVTLLGPMGRIKLPFEQVYEDTYSVTYNLTSLPKGEYTIVVELNHTYATYPTTTTKTLYIYRNVTVTVEGIGISNDTMLVQGETTTVYIKVVDDYGNPVSDADVKLQILGQYIAFSYYYDKQVYVGSLTAVNMPAGENQFFVYTFGDYINGIVINDTLQVKGKPKFDVIVSPTTPEQYSTLRVAVRATDIYGFPIENESIYVIFNNKRYLMTDEGDGYYYLEFNIGYVYHGDYDLRIELNSSRYVATYTTERVTVLVKPPELNLTLNDFLTLTAIAFVLSFVGLIIYYSISKKFRTLETTADVSRIKRSLKILNYLYLAIMVAGLATIGSATMFANSGNFALAVALLGVILMEILLLYGIWMFRDTTEIIVTEKFNVIRFVLGLWHLLAVPAVIFGIFEWGSHIEWFAVYILQDTIDLGFAIIPTLYLSLLGTYITSFVVIVINIYREAIRNRNRIIQMRAGGTPEAVLLDEKETIMERLSNSIRLKSFIFLVVLGASIVTTTNLLRYYQLGVVVAIPLLIIVIVPYITSRILKLTRIFHKEEAPASAPATTPSTPTS